MTKKELYQYLLENGKNKKNILFRPILMHFAARHSGLTYAQFASDHRHLVKANIDALKEYDMDMVGIISDTNRETSALGANIANV